MSVERHISVERRLAYFRIKGHLQTRDFIDAFVDYTGDQLFDPKMTMLTNAAQLVGIRSNFSEIARGVSEVMQVVSRFDQPVPSVIYCTTNAAYGMGRVLQQVLEPVSNFRMTITRDPAEALRAAGLTDPDFETLEALLFQAAPDE